MRSDLVRRIAAPMLLAAILAAPAGAAIAQTVAAPIHCSGLVHAHSVIAPYREVWRVDGDGPTLEEWTVGIFGEID